MSKCEHCTADHLAWLQLFWNACLSVFLQHVRGPSLGKEWLLCFLNDITNNMHTVMNMQSHLKRMYIGTLFKCSASCPNILTSHLLCIPQLTEVWNTPHMDVLLESLSNGQVTTSYNQFTFFA